MAAIYEIRMRKLEATKKEAKLRAEKHCLAEQIKDIGGLWLDENEAEVNVAKIEKENRKKQAIALQITYRGKVLGAVHPDSTIFQKTVNKIPLDSSQLLQNLITIIQAADAETQVLQEASNSDRLQPKVFTKEQFLREKKKSDEKMIITEEKTDKKRGNEGSPVTCHVRK